MTSLAEKYKPYPIYKPSDVEWLGAIPAHWEVRRLKYLATVNDEALPETTDPDMEITFGAKRCGGGRRDFGGRAETDILGQPARNLRHIWRKLTGTSEHFE